MKNIEEMTVEIVQHEPEMEYPAKDNPLSLYNDSLPEHLKGLNFEQLPTEFQLENIKAMCDFFEHIMPNLSDRLFKATTVMGCALAQEDFPTIEFNSLFAPCFSNKQSHEVNVKIEFSFEKQNEDESKGTTVDLKESKEKSQNRKTVSTKTGKIWDYEMGTLSFGKKVFQSFPNLDEKDKMLVLIAMLLHIQNTIDMNAQDCSIEASGFSGGASLEGTVLARKMSQATISLKINIISEDAPQNMHLVTSKFLN